MASFKELLWHRIDVWAIVGSGGLATIEEHRQPACRAWLQKNGYGLDTLDCSRSPDEIAADLYSMLKWEAQFGYVPPPSDRNLDALRDGFQNFDTLKSPDVSGHVLELLHVDVAWEKEPEWISGLLAIASEHSCWQLALGRRFFTLLVLAEHSEMIGAEIDTVRVPDPFSNPHRGHHNFEY